jgi:hypothetical protein
VDNRFFSKLDFMGSLYPDLFGLILESKVYCYQQKMYIRYTIGNLILQLDLSTISSSVNWTSWVAHIMISLG